MTILAPGTLLYRVPTLNVRTLYESNARCGRQLREGLSGIGKLLQVSNDEETNIALQKYL